MNCLKVLIVENTPERQKTFKNLFKENAWILVNTAQRAKTLIEVYDFDLILLDFDIDGPHSGENIAQFIPHSRNADTLVWVHSMNAPGVELIQKHLPNAIAIAIAIAIAYSKITRDNPTFKILKEELYQGLQIDWAKVFRQKP